MRGIAAIAVLALWASGCILHVDRPGQPIVDPGPRRVMQTAALQYTPTPADVSNHVVGDDRGGDHVLRILSMPAHGPNGQDGDGFKAWYYQGKAPGPRPLVIVLPVWGISNYPSDKLTRVLLHRGGSQWDVVKVLGERYLFDWDALAESPDPATFEARLGANRQRIHDTVVDLRRLMDHLQVHHGVVPERTALVGFSIGAVVATLTLAHDDRFGAAVLMMGGGHLAEVFGQCRGRPGQVRKAILPRFGWNLDQYRATYARVFARDDPVALSGFPDASRLLLVEAGLDHCMQADGRSEFWKVLGQPRRIIIPSDHRRAFYALTPLGLGRVNRKVFRFLESRLTR